jgi:hypothetical protein
MAGGKINETKKKTDGAKNHVKYYLYSRAIITVTTEYTLNITSCLKL